jgi:hypothetical protein
MMTIRDETEDDRNFEHGQEDRTNQWTRLQPATVTVIQDNTEDNRNNWKTWARKPDQPRDRMRTNYNDDHS